ncbi:dihydrofolate reductase family protein [Robiginitalea sp. IMCC43444]|uniref:dihydrofolate reductase family protein n=1 Tax=Robiginitalea sp. IMCC43444 TaxID=3459121 RepID=UPI00404275C3
MNTGSSTVTIHMVSSLDGFVAKKDGDLSWMRSEDTYEDGVELSKTYVLDFLQSIDCYLLGSHTYAQAVELGWPYGEKPVFVLTSRKLKPFNKSVHFVSGDLAKIISDQLRPKFNSIWMGGGPSLAKELLRLGLADEINISIMPILLGNGTLFFDYIGKEQRLQLKNVTAFKDGMVELLYQIRNEL